MLLKLAKKAHVIVYPRKIFKFQAFSLVNETMGIKLSLFNAHLVQNIHRSMVMAVWRHHDQVSVCLMGENEQGNGVTFGKLDIGYACKQFMYWNWAEEIWTCNMDMGWDVMDWRYNVDMDSLGLLLIITKFSMHNIISILSSLLNFGNRIYVINNVYFFHRLRPPNNVFDF